MYLHISDVITLESVLSQSLDSLGIPTIQSVAWHTPSVSDRYLPQAFGMEVIEAITAVHGVAKLAYLLASTIYDVAKVAKDSSAVFQQLDTEVNSLRVFVSLVEQVESNITSRCDQNPDPNAVEASQALGSFDLLKEECEKLTTLIEPQLQKILQYQSDMANDSEFGRHLLTAMKIRFRLVLKIHDLYPRIERLKTSLLLATATIQTSQSEAGAGQL